MSVPAFLLLVSKTTNGQGLGNAWGEGAIVGGTKQADWHYWHHILLKGNKILQNLSRFGNVRQQVEHSL